MVVCVYNKALMMARRILVIPRLGGVTHVGRSQASHRPFLEMKECDPFYERYHQTETGVVVSVNGRGSLRREYQSVEDYPVSARGHRQVVY